MERGLNSKSKFVLKNRKYWDQKASFMSNGYRCPVCRITLHSENECPNKKCRAPFLIDFTIQYKKLFFTSRIIIFKPKKIRPINMKRFNTFLQEIGPIQLDTSTF